MRIVSYLLILFICFSTNINAQLSKPVTDALNTAQKHREDKSYLTYLQDAEQTAIEAKDVYGQGEVYRIIGDYYSSISQDSCILYHHKAFKVFMDNRYKKAGILRLYDIARAYEKKQAYSTALDYATNSIFLYEEAKDTLAAAKMYQYSALMKAELKMYESAKNDIGKAIELYTIKKMTTNIADCWLSMGKVYMLEGKTDSTAIFYKKAKQH